MLFRLRHSTSTFGNVLLRRCILYEVDMKKQVFDKDGDKGGQDAHRHSDKSYYFIVKLIKNYIFMLLYRNKQMYG